VANKQNSNRATDKLWVRIMCGVLGGLLAAGTVFMVIQIIIGT